jgi:hypothetical protein
MTICFRGSNVREDFFSGRKIFRGDNVSGSTSSLSQCKCPTWNSNVEPALLPSKNSIWPEQICWIYWLFLLIIACLIEVLCNKILCWIKNVCSGIEPLLATTVQFIYLHGLWTSKISEKLGRCGRQNMLQP